MQREKSVNGRFFTGNFGPMFKVCRQKKGIGINMDIKEKIESVVEKIAKNPNIKEQFEKEPVKVIEDVLGVDLPDDVVEKIIDGVKAKMTVDTISDVAGALKKLF